MTIGAMRPLERRILSMVEAGTDFAEIARKFRRSPEFISRVVEIARLPHSDAAGPSTSTGDDEAVPGEAGGAEHGAAPGSSGAGRHPLRPIERLVLKSQAAGVPMDLMARQFKRSTAHLERIADLATYKLGNRSD